MTRAAARAYVLQPPDLLSLIRCFRIGLNPESGHNLAAGDLTVEFSGSSLLAQVRCRIWQFHPLVSSWFAFSLWIDMVPGSQICCSVLHRRIWYEPFVTPKFKVGLSFARTLRFRSLTIELAPSSLSTLMLDVRTTPRSRVLFGH